MKSRAVAGLKNSSSIRALVRKSIFVTAASAAVFGASAAHADSEQALDSCIKSFIASNMAGFAGKVTINKDYLGYQPLAFAPHGNIEFTVIAHDKIGEKLLSATCVAKRNGTVVSLKTEVLSTKVAESFGPKIEVLDAGG